MNKMISYSSGLASKLRLPLFVSFCNELSLGLDSRAMNASRKGAQAIFREQPCLSLELKGSVPGVSISLLLELITWFNATCILPHTLKNMCFHLKYFKLIAKKCFLILPPTFRMEVVHTLSVFDLKFC